MKKSRSEYPVLRGLDCHVRRWGDPRSATLILLHGWLDTSATFQFLVDALEHDWNIIAPDWPGYGHSQRSPGPYWMYDDIAVLDALVRHYSPDAPVKVAGHSYGGQIATFYGGARPERLRLLINLEGFGPKQRDVSEAPQALGEWLDGIDTLPGMRRYPDEQMLARRLMQSNPRLCEERARYLALATALQHDDGTVSLNADPWRRLRGLSLSYPTAEHFIAFLERIQAPTLWLHGDDSNYMRFVFDQDGLYPERLQALADAEDAEISGAGHNLHHDQPFEVARHLERFLLRYD